MAIKYYPSKYPTHFAISAALELRRALGDRPRIKALHITAPDMEDADRPQPRSGLEGKFSFQYTAAIALLDGAVRSDSFTDERRFRPDVVDLLGKISLTRDARLSRDTRNTRIEIEATLEDGARKNGICTKPPGSWGLPVDPASHRAKLSDCLATRFRDGEARSLLDALDRLEDLTARELGEIARILS
jgi:aconitate decarboxylase